MNDPDRRVAFDAAAYARRLAGRARTLDEVAIYGRSEDADDVRRARELLAILTEGEA